MEKELKSNNVSKLYYEHPQVDVINFDYSDIIATSLCNTDDCPSNIICIGVNEQHAF